MLGDLGGGKVTAMRGRNHETGPEGPWEEGLGDQRGRKGRAKGAEEHPRGVTIIDPGPPLVGNVGFLIVKPLFSLVPLGRSKVLLGGLWGGKVRAMRGRDHETGPEGPWEEGLGDQRGPKGRAKGAEEQPTGQQVTHCDH